MAEGWSQYQEEAAAFFRTLGWSAETNVTLKGVHTEHDVDVVAKSRQAGFEVTWIVECKLWTTRVTKNHVLALRTIVSDLGADRGLLLAENGFQSGAVEAAALTNVHVSTLAEVRSTSEVQVLALRLSELYERIGLAKERYWDMPKSLRIKYKLRAEGWEHDYSGNRVIVFVEDMLRLGFRGKYPFNVIHEYRVMNPQVPAAIASSQELVQLLEPLVAELERRLDAADQAGTAES